MLDKAFRSAEACRSREEPELCSDVEGARASSGDDEREHSAKLCHLPFGSCVTGIVRQTGVVDTLNSMVTRKKLRHVHGILTMDFHPARERSNASKD